MRRKKVRSQTMIAQIHSIKTLNSTKRVMGRGGGGGGGGGDEGPQVSKYERKYIYSGILSPTFWLIRKLPWKVKVHPFHPSTTCVHYLLSSCTPPIPSPFPPFHAFRKSRHSALTPVQAHQNNHILLSIEGGFQDAFLKFKCKKMKLQDNYISVKLWKYMLEIRGVRITMAFSWLFQQRQYRLFV